MADDRSGSPESKPGDKAPSPSPLPERARAAAGEVAKGLKGLVSGEQDASHELKGPPHTPAAEGDESSDAKARGKNPGDASPSFMERMEKLREMVRSFGPVCESQEEIEHDGP